MTVVDADPRGAPITGSGDGGGVAWRAAIQADHFRLRDRRSGAARVAIDAALHKTFRALCAHRLYRHARLARNPTWRAVIPLLAFWRRFACLSIGAEIAWEAEIGPGCRILHGFGLVILPCARIGRNVTLAHGVVVGYRAAPEAPTTPLSVGVVGDDCFVGPYAFVWAHMGEGSILAPHAMLTRDAPARSVLVGAPARVMRRLGEASSVDDDV